MIDYDPKDATSCIPGGEYEAILTKVEETQSKNGNDMYVLHWSILVNPDKQVTLRDYAVIPKGLFKLKGLARSWGLLGQFEARQFDPFQHIDRRATVVVEIQDSAQYGEQNNITGYRQPPTPQFSTPPPAQKPQEEEIPF